VLFKVKPLTGKNLNSVKVVVVADTHFGNYPYGHLDVKTKMNSRMLDLFANFDRVVNFAIQNKVDFFLHCGDVYKIRSPKNPERREFLKRVKLLIDAKINCIFVIGNHDISDDGHSLDFEELFLPYVSVVSEPTMLFFEVNSKTCKFFCLPWLSKALDFQEEATRFFKLVNTENDADINIMSAHLHVQEAKIGLNDFNLFGDSTLLLADLISLNLDAVYLGHIHKQQILAQDPFVAYAGSLGKINFGERLESKGFYYGEF